jgi:hypothetical protein
VPVETPKIVVPPEETIRTELDSTISLICNIYDIPQDVEEVSLKILKNKGFTKVSDIEELTDSMWDTLSLPSRIKEELQIFIAKIPMISSWIK